MRRVCVSVCVCLCVRVIQRERGGKEGELPRDPKVLKTQTALGEPLSIFWGSLINVNMGSITGAVLKLLLLLSTQNWNRIIAGNSCKYTANDLELAVVVVCVCVWGGSLQNFNSVVFMIIICNWNCCRAYCYK